MTKFDLPVMGDTRKSFYGKARVIERDNGDVELESYNTIVFRVRNGKFENCGMVIQ